jgi:hypothetical protein
MQGLHEENFFFVSGTQQAKVLEKEKIKDVWAYMLHSMLETLRAWNLTNGCNKYRRTA